MSTTTLPLMIAFGVQCLVGAPLLQPYKVLHGPSVNLYRLMSTGPGLMVSGTIACILTVLFASSAYEAFSARKELGSSNSQALVSEAATVRGQLSMMLCAANIMITAAFNRLAVETGFHDRLKISHAALAKQASGLSQEYMRATASADAADAAAAQVKKAIEKGDGGTAQQQLETLAQEVSKLKDEITVAAEARETAEKLAADLRLQYTGLEESFDTLMRENEALKRGQAGASTSNKEE